MKYCSVNRLQDFEFHDAEFTPVSFDGGQLIVLAKYMNVHKGIEQNFFDFDMEADLARITFERIRILAHQSGGDTSRDQHGNIIKENPLITVTGMKAADRFRDELKGVLSVYHIALSSWESQPAYEIGAFGISPYFTAWFSFDSVKIEWDSYRDKAWYEKEPFYRDREYLHLDTPSGEIVEILTVDRKEENDDNTELSLTLRYNGEKLCVIGKHFLMLDAFANLQKSLPDGVTIKCCLTCRHGNLCPFGNVPDEFFCTKDIINLKMDDLYFCTQDDTERDKRMRKATFFCDDFKPQEEQFLTYSDYLHYLNS